MNELIVAATEREVLPYLGGYSKTGCIRDTDIYRSSTSSRVICISNPGPVSASLSVSACLEKLDVDRVLSVGVAGALPGSDLDVGDVVVGEWVEYADLGRERNREFDKLTDMGIETEPVKYRLGAVDFDLGYRLGGIATVSTVSATDKRASRIVDRTGAVAETMETAAVAQTAYRFDIPVSAVVSISNYCGNVREFDLEAAADKLSKTLKSTET